MSSAGGGVGDDGFANVGETRLARLALGVDAAGLRGLATGLAAGIFMPGIEPCSIPGMLCASAVPVTPSDATATRLARRLTPLRRAGAR